MSGSADAARRAAGRVAAFTCNETQQIFGTQGSALATGWTQFVPTRQHSIETAGVRGRVRPMRQCLRAVLFLSLIAGGAVAQGERTTRIEPGIDREQPRQADAEKGSGRTQHERDGEFGRNRKPPRCAHAMSRYSCPGSQRHRPFLSRSGMAVRTTIVSSAIPIA